MAKKDVIKQVKELSPKSQAIIDRGFVHRDRCRQLEAHLGEGAAKAFHLKYKADPGSEQARKEFEKLIGRLEN